MRVVFRCTLGVRWQELHSPGPEDRNDQVYEIAGSAWLREFEAHSGHSEHENLRHFRLCFDAAGVLDVIAASMELGDSG